MNSRILLFYFFLFISCFSLFCQWSNDPATNLQVTDWGRNHRIASDGNGGVYIGAGVTFATVDTPKAHHYLLRLNRYGYYAWPDTIRIGGTEDVQGELKLLADGNGGVLAAFTDQKFLGYSGFDRIYDFKIKVQRIDSSGNRLWGDGISVCLDTTDQYDLEFTNDGNGGCFVSWTEELDFYSIWDTGSKRIQHISSTGQRMWSDTGIVLFEENVYYDAYPVISDGVDGVIVDYINKQGDSLLRRMDTNGNVLWEVPKRIQYGKMVNDRNGGLVYVGFKLINNNSERKLSVDNITPTGEYGWGDSVVTIADSVGQLSKIKGLYYSIDSVATILWQNIPYPSTTYNGYIQRINFYGEIQYPGSGIEPSMISADNRSVASLIPSDDTTFICTFSDTRQTKDNVGPFAQKISISGIYLWDSTDVRYSTRQYASSLGITDGNGGFIGIWMESIYGIWAQQVSKNGNLGEVVLSVIPSADHPIPNKYLLLSNFPNPFNNETTVEFILNKNAHITLKIYDIQGRKVHTIYDGKNKAGKHKINWSGTNYEGKYVSTGIYILRMVIKSRHDIQQISRKIILLK